MNTDRVLSIFSEITRVPRESGHEEKIVAWLQKFAADRGLECRTDKTGNVLIVKEASPGYENRPAVVLQSHSDMVCEKLPGVDFDFSRDAIRYEIEDGWMIAKETTLGADCGIGMASALAVIDDPQIVHPKVECLFTVSEETGLDGARALKPGFFSAKTLINLDDEDEGYFCVGCAGGNDMVGTYTYSRKKTVAGAVFTKFAIGGGIGGHSGDNIGDNRMNAVQQIGRFVNRAFAFGVDLCEIDGGNKRNAIARDSYAVLAIPARSEDKVVDLFNRFAAEVKAEFAASDPDIFFTAEPVVWKGGAIDLRTAKGVVNALVMMPHGVMAMSNDIEGLVETSTNLASVKMVGNDRIQIGTMQRSSVNSARLFLCDRVKAVFDVTGADSRQSDGYSGWKPNMDSAIKDICVASYRKLFGKEPVVRAIHAGLECGLFTEKFPDVDMIAFGPTLRGVHAPGEKLDLASLDRFFSVLVEILKTI